MLVTSTADMPSGAIVAVTLPASLFTDSSAVVCIPPIDVVTTQSPRNGALSAGAGAGPDDCAAPGNTAVENAIRNIAAAAATATQTGRMRRTMGRSSLRMQGSRNPARCWG